MDGLGFIMPELDSSLRSKRTSSRIIIDEISGNESPTLDKKARATGSSNLSMKFLISNNSAGFLIGKAGATIAELQASTKARINISQSGEFFPGTLDRAVLLVGSVPSLMGCQSMIWNRLAPSLPIEETIAPIDGHEPIITGKLLIPSSISGLIIGRGGSTIQLIAETSGAKLKLSPKEDAEYTHERILTITGTLSACITATSQVIAKFAEDEEAAKYANPTTCYDRSPFIPPPAAEISRSSSLDSHGSAGGRISRTSSGGSGGSRRVFLDSKVASSSPGQIDATASVFIPAEALTLSATTKIEMSVPDAYIGVVLGAGGSAVAEITKFTGAKITVSRRGEYIEGTTNRSVLIVGTPQAAQAAHLVIAEKVKQAIADGSGGARVRGASSTVE